jgi:hypothetical protein
MRDLGADAGRVRRALRLGRAFLIVTAGTCAGVSLYVGFIQAGVIQSPFAPVLQGDLEAARSDHPGVRVLFVGNSWTYYNAMPQTVQKLGAGDSGAPPVFAVSYTRPGWTLESASRDRRLVELIRDIPWNTVVLQEQTGRASSAIDRRSRNTDPYVRELQSRIEARGARTLLYMTWPYRDASDLAGVLGLPVAPVGAALVEAYRRRPELALWSPDGHPSRAGSFLAASVFYAALTKRDPTGSTFTAGLPEADARFLKAVAAKLVNHTK